MATDFSPNKEIGNRIKALLDLADKTLGVVSEDSGIPQRRLENLVAGKIAATVAELQDIARVTNKNPRWLIEGTGNPLLPVNGDDGRSDFEQAQVEAHYGELDRATRDPSLVYVPFLNVSASAGGGYLNDEYETPHKFHAFSRTWIEGTLGDDHSYAATIKVVGDSMQPRLVSGDIVLVNTKIRTVQPGRVMIVWSAKDGLKIKRVGRRNGIPWATSDNLDTSETPAEFQFEEQNLRGLVFWHGGDL